MLRRPVARSTKSEKPPITPTRWLSRRKAATTTSARSDPTTYQAGLF